MTRIAIDPITRIEGHLRIECNLDDKNVIRAELGRPTTAIQRSAVALLFLTDDRDLALKLRSRPIDRPSIIGNVDEVREIVREYREAGVDELIVPDCTLGPRDQKLATLDRFIREVAAPLR